MIVVAHVLKGLVELRLMTVVFYNAGLEIVQLHDLWHPSKMFEAHAQRVDEVLHLL